MNFSKFSVTYMVVATLLVLTTPISWAGEGHDHGEAAPVAGAALPRFTAVSETFELVGVLSGKQITLYLDRFATNNPVRDAQIELEIGSAKFKAKKHDADEYEVMLPEVPKPGVRAVTATVTVGTEADLLAGELDIHADARGEKRKDALGGTAAHSNTHSDAHDHAHVHSRWEYVSWAVGGLALLAVLLWVGRRLFASRRVSARGAA